MEAPPHLLASYQRLKANGEKAQLYVDSLRYTSPSDFFGISLQREYGTRPLPAHTKPENPPKLGTTAWYQPVRANISAKIVVSSCTASGQKMRLSAWETTTPSGFRARRTSS